MMMFKRNTGLTLDGLGSRGSPQRLKIGIAYQQPESVRERFTALDEEDVFALLNKVRSQRGLSFSPQSTSLRGA